MDYIAKAKEQIAYWNDEENFSSGRERAEAEANCKIWKPIATLIEYYEDNKADGASPAYLFGFKAAIEIAIAEALGQ